MLFYLCLVDSQDERDKFKEIYDLYKNRMLYTANQILNDHHESEDAVHNAFIAIARNIHKIKEIDSPETSSYVLKAAKNMALNLARGKNKRDKQKTIEDCVFAKSGVTTLESLCNDENYEIIKYCILSLDEKYRDVLSLRYLNELSIKEIAVSLGRKTSTVKQQISRGKRLLVAALVKEGVVYGEVYVKTDLSGNCPE